jgi:ankyrin repeat protein
MLIKSGVLLLTLLISTASARQDQGEEFLAAARKGDIAAVKALLAKGVDVNTKSRYGATALSFACDRENTELVRVLIEHGADVNVQDTFYKATPIVWAGQKGNAEIVKLLLDRGARGIDQALMMGVGGGHTAMVKVVLEKGGVLPQTLTLALTQATRAKQTEIVELLKNAGAKPAPEANFKVDEETLKSYAGRYKNKDGQEVVFTLKEGKLVGGPVGRDPYTAAAIDKTTFTLVGVDGITFTFNIEGGKVASFTLKEGGNTTVYTRQEEK